LKSQGRAIDQNVLHLPKTSKCHKHNRFTYLLIKDGA